MDKAWIIRIGLIFLILSFFIGFFWPIVFSPDQEQAASPTPSVLPAFSSTDNTTATVKRLDNRLVLFCDNAKPELLATYQTEFMKVEGVERVLIGTNVIDVALSANVSSNSIDLVTGLFLSGCPAGGAYRRSSELEFHSTVTFTPPQGDPIVARLPSALCSQPNWNCLVLSVTQLNATIPVSVTLTRLDSSGDEQGFVQEQGSINFGNSTNSS